MRYEFYRVNRFDDDFAATAIHGIDAVKFLAGSDYRHIRFDYQAVPETGAAAVNIRMFCEFASGALVDLLFMPVSGALLERATVHLEHHTFFLCPEMSTRMPGRFRSRGKLAAFLEDNRPVDRNVLRQYPHRSGIFTQFSSRSLEIVIELPQTSGFEPFLQGRQVWGGGARPMLSG